MSQNPYVKVLYLHVTQKTEAETRAFVEWPGAASCREPKSTLLLLPPLTDGLRMPIPRATTKP